MSDVDLTQLATEEGIEIAPGVRVRLRSLADYRQNEENPVSHTPRNLDAVIKSIHKVGAGRSGFASKGKIVAGNLTWEAMAEAGIEGVVEVTTDGTKWVMVNREDLTTEQEKQAAYGDQQGSFLAGWDLDRVLADVEAGVDLSGLLTDVEIETILGEALMEVETGEAPEAQLDRAGELQEKWQVQRGQIWEIPSKRVEGQAHRLMCGDTNEDIDELFNGQKPSLLLTDPPYGISIVGGLRATVGGSKPVTIGSVRGRRTDTVGGVKNIRGTVGAANMVDATLYRPVHGDDKPFDPMPLLSIADNAIIWGGNYFASKLPDSRCWIVWDKENTGNFADAELAWTSFDKPTQLYRFKWSGLVREGKRDIEGMHRVHPTQKPVGLFANILKDFSEESALIADLYLGSGTTLLACELCGQISLCMEIEPAYVAITLDRAERMGLEPKLLE